MEKRRRKPATKQTKDRGQMRPFTLEQVTTLEALLRQDGSSTAIRDLALLRVGIDSMLRSSDMVALTLRDLMPNGEIASDVSVKPKKTAKSGRRVQFDLSAKTCASVSDFLAFHPEMQPDDRVFAITTRQHQRIVKGWCELLKLDGSLYSTHSIRRTRAAHLYAQTKNIKAVMELLGHKTVHATGDYLGVNNQDARELARQFPI